MGLVRRFIPSLLLPFSFPIFRTFQVLEGNPQIVGQLFFRSRFPLSLICAYFGHDALVFGFLFHIQWFPPAFPFGGGIVLGLGGLQRRWDSL